MNAAVIKLVIISEADLAVRRVTPHQSLPLPLCGANYKSASPRLCVGNLRLTRLSQMTTAAHPQKNRNEVARITAAQLQE